MGEGATRGVIVSQTQGNHTATVKVVHTSRCHVKTSIQENTECGATCDQMAQVMLNEQTDSDIKRQLPTVVGGAQKKREGDKGHFCVFLFLSKETKDSESSEERCKTRLMRLTSGSRMKFQPRFERRTQDAGEEVKSIPFEGPCDFVI